jgi:hypothetical protein
VAGQDVGLGFGAHVPDLRATVESETGKVRESEMVLKMWRGSASTRNGGADTIRGTSRA